MLNFLVASLLFSIVSMVLLNKNHKDHFMYHRALLLGSMFWSKWAAITAVVFIYLSISFNIIGIEPISNSILTLAPLMTPFEMIFILIGSLFVFTPGALIACSSLMVYLSFRTVSQLSTLSYHDPAFLGLILLIGCFGSLALLVDRLPWIDPGLWRHSTFSPSTFRKITVFLLMLLSLTALFKCFYQISDFLKYCQETLKYPNPKYYIALLFSVIIVAWIAIGVFGPTPPLLFALPVPSVTVWSFANPYGNLALIIPFMLLVSLLIFPQEKSKSVL